MKYNKIFIIFLSIFVSLSKCLIGLSSFNITKIELDGNGCNEKEGRFHFKIRGHTDSKPSSYYLLYLFMESPPNAQATCLPPFFDTEEGFSCSINIVENPLTEKSVRLPKNTPSYPYYTFVNWEEYIDKNGNVIAENLDCNPIIRNTFFYSSFEKNESTLLIKGKWLDNSLMPTIAMQARIILNNSTKYAVPCNYDIDKIAFNCNVDKDEIIDLVDQLITGSDNNVYKLENSENNENSSSIIALNLTLLLLCILFL